MSIDAGLYMKIVLSELDRLDLLLKLTQAGWKMNDDDRIVLLPIGDDDDFDWKSLPATAYEEAWDTLRKKNELSETLGVVLSYGHTGIGGEFLFENDGNLTFSPSKNRRLISSNGDWTDVSWYIEKIIPVLEPGAVVESWEWTERR